MVVWEISVGGNPTNPAHVHAGIVPVHKNHIDTKATLIPENHVDAGTVLILKNQVDIKTVHVRAGMLTKVRIPQKSNGHTMQLWMLWVVPYEEPLGRRSQMKLNGP